jgi:hypothetical protein
MEITHHVHGYHCRAEPVEIDQDVTKGQNPKDEPAVAQGLAQRVRHSIVLPAVINLCAENSRQTAYPEFRMA